MTTIKTPAALLMGAALAAMILKPVSAETAPSPASWEQVVQFDSPLSLPPDGAKARRLLEERFRAQIAACQSFLSASPDSPHAYEVRVRLVVARARLASLQGDAAAVSKAVLSLKELEKQAPDNQLRAETTFRRISLQWQNLGGTPDEKRQNATALALTFANAFPNDRRAPRLLAEAAELNDSHPQEKGDLIGKALELSHEEPLTRRLQDDKKRLSMLGKPVDLSFTDLGGEEVNLSSLRGHVVALVFWSSESAPSLVWMKYFAAYAKSTPGVTVVTVSLDRNKSDLETTLRALGINWPTRFSGKAWEDPIVREFGINTLPTLWLLDRDGRLAFLNARDSYELKIKSLLLKSQSHPGSEQLAR
jgi:hypothetical protein